MQLSQPWLTVLVAVVAAPAVLVAVAVHLAPGKRSLASGLTLDFVVF